MGATLGGAQLILRRPAWAEAHLWRILAFGSGVLLAMTFLHLLPEAWGMNPRWASGAVLAALGAALSWRNHRGSRLRRSGGALRAAPRRLRRPGGPLPPQSLADGLAIAFAFQSSQTLGTAVALAVVVHKFSDGMTLSSLFLGAGHAPGRAGRLSGVLSLATPLGVLIGGVLGAPGHGSRAGGAPGVGRRRFPLCEHGRRFAADSPQSRSVVLGLFWPGHDRGRHAPSPMKLQVNGEEKDVASVATLADFLAALNLAPGRLACEVNGAAVRRADYGATALREGDQIEIVQMIGGG